jgi:Zn-dependent peptidase ImmA (M78 family)
MFSIYRFFRLPKGVTMVFLNKDVSFEISMVVPRFWSSEGNMNLEELARHYNASVSYVQFKDKNIDGAVQKLALPNQAVQYKIAINSERPLNRQRYTLAHELGHIISDKCGSYSKVEFDKSGLIKDKESDTEAILHRDETKNPCEYEANQIAANLLMPTLIVKQYVSLGLTIKKMAEILGVSEQALNIQKKNLGM